MGVRLGALGNRLRDQLDLLSSFFRRGVRCVLTDIEVEARSARTMTSRGPMNRR